MGQAPPTRLPARVPPALPHVGAPSVPTSPYAQGTHLPQCWAIVLSHYRRDTNFVPVGAAMAHGIRCCGWMGITGTPPASWKRWHAQRPNSSVLPTMIAVIISL
jgi:hypothetical protein